MAKENKKKQIEEEQVEDTDAEVTEDTTEAESQEDLARKIEALEKEKEELQNKNLRQMAEFDNFKKRTQREKDELYNYAKADCVEMILGVLDNFERALETQCSDETFKQGIEMIFNQMNECLGRLGVEEIPAQGETFDPDLHNAVNQVEDDAYGENTVCQVFQKGYRIGDRVIRHSMVVVANP